MSHRILFWDKITQRMVEQIGAPGRVELQSQEPAGGRAETQVRRGRFSEGHPPCTSVMGRNIGGRPLLRYPTGQFHTHVPVVVNAMGEHLEGNSASFSADTQPYRIPRSDVRV